MFRFLLAAVVLTAISQSARAALFAGNASNYTQGTVYYDDSGNINTFDMSFNDPTVVGDPTSSPLSGLTDFDFPPVGIISPFEPPSDSDQAVTVGYGGTITLMFPQPINVVPGGTIGVFTTTGLVDTDYNSGLAGSTASTFEDQSAIVQVSLDGKKWYSLGMQVFSNPENYFTNATDPYGTSIPDNAQVADFGQPFYGTLSSFDGLDYAQILSLFNGSAGGTWLDLTGISLTQVQYIQFSEPEGVVPMTSFVGISAIAASDQSVPEPTSAAALLVLAGLMLRRRAARSI
jgi:hypothetical protein